MDNEVQFDKSFKKFLVYLFLSAFIGLFGRFSIQSYLNKVWEPLQEQAEKEGVVVGQPKLQLARYGLPVFGATLEEVLYTKEIDCFVVDSKVGDVFVPFPWELFYKQDWAFGGIKFGTVSIDVEEVSDKCQAKSAVASSSPQPSQGSKASNSSNSPKEIKVANKRQSWLRPFDKWFNKHQEWSEKNLISSLFVENLQLHFSNLKDKHVTAFGSGAITFNSVATIELQLSLLEFRKAERKILSEFNGYAEANADEVVLKGRWTFNEGKFNSDIRVNKAGDADVLLASNNIPLGVLNRWIDTPWSFQFLWLNCEMSTHAARGEWQTSKWDIESCQISSPHGRVALLNKALTSLKKPEKVEIEIEDLDLDQILKNKDQLPLAGVFKNFGVLDGRVELEERQWQSELELKDAAIVFSKVNLRKLQPVKQILISGEYKKGDYKLHLKGISLDGGEFKGDIFLGYNTYRKEGSGKIKVESLLFNSDIQKLMIAGEVSPISIQGAYLLGKDFELQSWEGDLSFERYSTEGVSVSHAKAKTTWAPEGGLKIQAQVSQLQALKNSAMQWLFATLLEEDKASLTLSDIRGEALLRERVLEWQKLIGKVENQDSRFESSGSYGSNYVLRGTWMWHKGEQELPWAFYYASNEYFWLPQEDWLKEWLQSRDDFMKAYGFLRLEKPKI